jgi:hypothetical protein
MLNEIFTARPQPLFTPVQMGKLQLPNRIIMAPLTRMRAANPGHVPSELHVEYYAQRASAGLIIGECTEISPDAYGWADTPGLWSAEQVRGWRGVTDAVHKKGGLMYAQLWHTGAMSHPDFFDGALPMSASNVNPEQESVTPSGRKPTVAPRPMSKDEIRQTVADFGIAAKNAMEAGFDGVQIQANYLYLIAQFLNSATNLRKDEYGGSTVNRMPPSPLTFQVRVKGTIDWRAELAADGADHARGHIAGVFQKSPEKSYGAELDSKSQTHVYAAAAQHECPIAIIEMKISGQLFGGNLVRKPPVAPLLLGREETDRHQLWSLLASTRYTEARPMPSRSAIAVAPSFSSVRRRRTSAGSIYGLRPV